MDKMDLSFKIYNINISLQGANVPALQDLLNDFKYFPQGFDWPEVPLKITFIKGSPDRSVIDRLYFFSHLGSNVYGWGDIRYIEHPQAMVYINARTNEATVTSLNDDLLYHYAYYLIISKVGERLDLQGLHRFHAFGFSSEGHAAMMSAGVAGGKTTLALEMLKHPGVSLFSEDTPLVDNDGLLWPFPARFCLRPQSSFAKEAGGRSVVDPVVGSKVLVSAGCLGEEKIARAPKPLEKIFLGIFRPQGAVEIKKMSRIRFLLFIFKQIVLGWDCPQRVEFFFRFSPGGIRSLGRMFFNRLGTACAIGRKAEGYYFFMPGDIEDNAAFIRRELKKERS